MKKCKAITKAGTECTANGAHIVPTVGKGDVAYSAKRVPTHVDQTWVSGSINVCGAHRKMLADGKAINIITTPVMVNKITNTIPKEEIMTNTCKFCNGTGVDNMFRDPCKCTVPRNKDQSEMTPKQQKYILDLGDQIQKIIRCDLAWANVSMNKSDASETIQLLMMIKTMVGIMRVKKQHLNTVQIETIREKINSKPTREWVAGAQRKLTSIAS